MGREIERKFLVVGDDWRPVVEQSRRFEQGYLAITDDCAVRVRIDGEDSAILNIKNATLDVERQEYEYPVPLDDAREMLDTLCAGRVLSKVRHWVDYRGGIWEVDVFEGANRGLVLAEIELDSRDQHIQVPAWVGREVSGDPRYLNSSLAVSPFTTWGAG
ncbi:MAG: CYTH domain-containing protein [Gammaproteobacteria bacterium]|nr:CYTH domain-containing protein [Gammaproteobacteria bacterium]